MKFLLFLICLLLRRCDSKIISKSSEIVGAGLFRYHYDDNHTQHKSVVILGVGTAMTISDYDLVAKEIVLFNTDSIVFVIDPEPDWFIKTNAERYAKLANAIVDETLSKNCTVIVCSIHLNRHDLNILVGGHSAGGEAAMGSLPHLSAFTPKGYLLLDPFEIDENHSLDSPALFWGFSTTTCGVNVDKAAKAGYQITSKKHRVFYQIQNDSENDKMIHHCIFTNNGCCACPKILPLDKQKVILELVGKSTNRFLRAINEKSFMRKAFELGQDDDGVTLFVNEDQVDDGFDQNVNFE